jgi:hypothetical protein
VSVHAHWLDALPPGPRRVLLGVTAAALLLGTALSGVAAPGARDGIALGVVLGLAGAWAGVWVWLGRPAVARRQAARLAEEDERARDRGLIVSSAAPPERTGLQAVVARDPGFSLPVLHDLVRALHRRTTGAEAVHGPIRVLDARIEGERTRLSVLVRASRPDGAAICRILRLSRPTGTASLPPEPVAAGADGGWRVDAAEDVEAPPEPPIIADPAMPAARRALLLRAEAFDLGAFEALVDEIDAALDHAGGDPAVAPYTTPSGAECVRWWAAGEGIPPSEPPTEWIAVEEDGWSERIEVRRGARVLGLLRRAGQPDAPWQLWRLRRAP